MDLSGLGASTDPGVVRLQLVAAGVDNREAIQREPLVAYEVKTPTHHLRLWSLLVVTLLTLAACSGPGEVGGSAPSTVSDEDHRQGSEKPAGQVEAPGGESEGDSEEADTAEETDEWFLDFDQLLAAVSDSEPVVLDSEATGSDLILGGSPDSVSAAAITIRLEDAGFDLSGIEVSVLPVTGMDASLLVLEVSDEAVVLGGDDTDDDNEFVKTLLAMPEIDEASITELVTMYRGVDDRGSFAVTFTISISALEQALASGSEIGDDMLVQFERSS